MLSDLLPAYVEAAIEQAREEAGVLMAGPKSLREVLSPCGALRIAGIGELLMTGRPKSFSRRLHQSARLFAHLLGRLPDSTRLTSRAYPFFDALAVGDVNAATAIAAVSRRAWAQGEEHEEDFLYVYTTMQICRGSRPTSIADSLVSYEAALNGTEDPRLAVLRALAAQDSDRFDESIRQWLAAREAAMDAKASKASQPPELLATEWHVCIEAIALVRLARAQGITTADEYEHVPSVTLKPITDNWDQVDWRAI